MSWTLALPIIIPFATAVIAFLFRRWWEKEKKGDGTQFPNFASSLTRSARVFLHRFRF